jgi:hypothetical protein
MLFLIFFFVANYTPTSDKGGFLFILFFTLFFLYFFSLLFFGELRTKLISVVFSVDSISKKSFCGLGPTKSYLFKEVIGYKTSVVQSRSGSYEYLYLIVDSKKVIKISEFYHENYKALKLEVIKNNIINLGFEQWRLFNEMKEIFF